MVTVRLLPRPLKDTRLYVGSTMVAPLTNVMREQGLCQVPHSNRLNLKLQVMNTSYDHCTRMPPGRE